MSASSHAQRERVELAELMLQEGPDAPTLCAPWTTRDLAAHLVVRESRPDAALGIAFSPLSEWTDRLTRSTATQPYPELVRKVRTGPPTLSFFSLPGVDSRANLAEYFVHHEDVRRAQPGWTPRQIPPSLADDVWTGLRRSARLMFRRVPVGVTLVRTDGPGGSIVARPGEPMVTLTGTAQELLLRAFGRTEVQVDVDGEPDAVARFESAALGI